ncbi:MAG TPA: SCO6880 family protein, partial [Kineosporiaceae bacterium]|nr:SCO6880 family protein [Kineosporiaceae bacterium]
PTGSDRRAAAEVAAIEIGTRLPGLARALAATGAGQGRPVTAEGLAARVRGWYDPFAQPALAEVEALGRDAGIGWEQAGPVAAQETWDTYRHDSGLSRTLEMVTPPRGTVYDDVLTPLIGPMSATLHKRVTLLYRPVDSADAPGALDLQVRAAMNRAGRRSGVVHAHDSAEVRAALQAAAEEATGAGVVNFAVLVTVTVDGDPPTGAAELKRSTEAVTRAGRAAQIRLRPVTGAQAFAFTVGLGVGLSPSHLSFLPALLRANS